MNNHEKVTKLKCNANVHGQFYKIQSLVESDKRNFIKMGLRLFLFLMSPESQPKEFF